MPGPFKAEENAAEGDEDSGLLKGFNSHSHYSVGSQTTDNRFYQFCLLDVLYDSSLTFSICTQDEFSYK